MNAGKISVCLWYFQCVIRIINHTSFVLHCDSSPSVLAGVVTAVVFIAVCALAVISRLLYQQRRAQRSSKEEQRHGVFTDYRTELHLHGAVRDNMKEYYI